MPELADILRLYSPECHLPSHRRAIEDICACRTEALGGHVYHCPRCRREQYRYHSCKNRHCPKCQNDQTDRWIRQQKDLLLSVPFFMATFTLPEGLRRIARKGQKIVYDLLFQASRHALMKLAADPKHVGGSLGMIGVLQTWTRDLRYHPHVHYLIPGGGLASNGSWRKARHNYLLPEKPLARIFRAKFRDLLKKARLADQVSPDVWHQDWVVDIIAVGNGEAALKYLAPYVFRVAISNRSILAIKNGGVTFRCRSAEAATVPVSTFVHRFLQHVLPRGFQKVRAYGLLHPQKRHLLHLVKERLRRAGPITLKPAPFSASPGSLHPKAVLCPSCNCEMIHLRQILRKRGPP